MGRDFARAALLRNRVSYHGPRGGPDRNRAQNNRPAPKYGSSNSHLRTYYAKRFQNTAAPPACRIKGEAPLSWGKAGTLGQPNLVVLRFMVAKHEDAARLANGKKV